MPLDTQPITVQTLRDSLARFNSWDEVTIVTPDGVHHDISGVMPGQDNDGDDVICIEFTE